MSAKKQGLIDRKADHLACAAAGSAEFRNTSSLLDNVHLFHQALPELAVGDIDLSTTIVGHKLRAPLVIAAMTGGTMEARDINRDLAKIAERLGIGFGLGSQRAMAMSPELTSTFTVRDIAPEVFLLGNIGVMQARQMGVAKTQELVRRVEADALCVHLNPAMELIQDGGDRDYRGAVDTIRALVQELPLPVIVKETGSGLSREAARTLRHAGVTTVDVSGAGGTSWVAVETLRAPEDSPERDLGNELWDWGIPTAVSVALCAREGLEVIATGGIRSGHDITRALALGASAGGMAAPVLRAYRRGHLEGAARFLEGTISALRATMYLAGCGSTRDVAKAPRILTSPLKDWLSKEESA